MAQALVPVFTGTLADRTVQLCDARTLHTFMQVRRDFTTWIKGRIRKFGFAVGEDYLLKIGSPDLVNQTRGGNKKETTDYHLTLDMAKELSMVENNDQGRAARRYFIECERLALEAAPTKTHERYKSLPGDTLTLEQQEQLRTTLERAAEKLPREQQGKFLMQGWSKLKKHYGVSYRQIPQIDHTDALGLLARHCVDWELVDDEPTQRRSLNDTIADLVRKLEEPNGYGTVLFMPLVEAVQRKLGKPIAPAIDPNHLQAILDASLDAGRRVQQTVAQAMLEGGGESWKRQRWMLHFIADSKFAAPAVVQQLPDDAIAASWPELVRGIATNDRLMTSAELVDMLAACSQRLQQRQPRLSA